MMNLLPGAREVPVTVSAHGQSSNYVSFGGGSGQHLGQGPDLTPLHERTRAIVIVVVSTCRDRSGKSRQHESEKKRDPAHFRAFRTPFLTGR